MVDDIDYFTFPVQMLESNIAGMNDEDFAKFRQKMANAKQIMTQ